MMHHPLKMASPSTAVAPEAESVPRESIPPVDGNLPINNEYRSEHEDDEEKDERNEDGDRAGGRGKNEDEEDENEYEDEEEEDLDFNPFLKDTPSREASSSLSSEIEGPDADIIDSGANTSVALVMRSRVKPSGYPVGGTEHEEEIVTQATPSSDGACSTGVENFSPSIIEEGRAVSTSQPENGALGEKNAVVDMDDEDAICKRTRARYSLASFTLDELETFLQETDDEDDIQNVDDQEEYRKFLAAVLLGGDGDSQNQQGNENVDDEDDDNDADFELEIEEALESDLDENTKDKIQKQEYEAVGRRHKTRRNRGQKSSIEHNKKLVALPSRPLRPLVPYVPIGHFSAFDGRSLMSKQVPQCATPVNDGLINGFTPHQIGQLFCLIHEHVQLLIQVFSISALDPTRKHIASEVQKMMMEMVRIRDQVLAWRKLPHPSICFFPPYVHPTVPDEHLKTLPSQLPSTFEAQRDCSSVSNVIPPSENNIVPPNGVEGTSWAPYISSPILSVLDVAPLGLAGKYMDDVAAVAAVRERQRIEVGDNVDTRFEREPLFPLSNRLPSSSNGDHMPKKTMAAALVEKVKKQSVAPVPKEISKLALRFYPLFNPALFPHKPPPSAVANRVLFTDSEDVLLAMGLMEYNTDWKAIQQRFLPCKSKHQIFVRQKNRSSSKAPENPIKAVRRMKNSPLTLQEIARIEEGLKIFKLDWISVWKFMVPYRDPSLLPRQWRIATGTQKSYKSDETKKAKRRLYDARRRMCKTSALAGWHTSSEKEDHSTDNAGEGNNSGDNNTDREDEAYVHEAFLADWRPGTSSTPHPASDQGGETKSIHTLRHEGSRVSVQMNLSGSGGTQAPAVSRSSQPYLRPYRARRANSAHLVKLAPDLPPVNLPPSVRIMSQTAFKNYQAGAASTALGADSRIGVPAAESEVLKAASAAKPGVNDPTKAGRMSNMAKTCTSYQYPQNCGVSKDKTVMEERDESGLQMHPLLFQTPEAGHLPYYPLNCKSGSTSFSFFSGSQPQLNLSLFHNFHLASHTVNILDKSLKPNETISSSGIDFHPFLQRNNGVNCELMNTHSAAQLCANPESSRGRQSQIQNPFDAALTTSCISASPSPVSAKPSSPYERSNELDLDIHLSFTSGKQKAVGSRDGTQHRMATSTASAPDSRLLVSQNTETLSDKHKLRTMTACTPDGIGNKLDSGAHALVLFSSGENRSDIDITGDQSLPGIVMEQEELSDSEEEIGENVEFECEEMADSEGEEASDCEQNLNLQTEVENTSVDTGLDDEHCKRRTRDDIDGHSCSLVEDHAVDLRSVNKGIDGARNFTCFNLNSCPPASPLVKRKYAAIRHSSGPVGETPSNKITRSTKPSTPHATGQTHANNMLEQSHNSSRKSRKRTCRSEGSSVSKGRSRKRDSSLISFTDEQSSIHVNKDEHG